METIIVSSSKSPQQNTLRVAHVLGDALEAKILSPEQATPGVLARADRIGFGSGIYSRSFDPALAQCIRSLPDMTGRDAPSYSQPAGCRSRRSRATRADSHAYSASRDFGSSAPSHAEVWTPGGRSD